ncbi:MAG: cyclopropane-fatty-acyl-phospholipid synthase family protein, partial [Sphingomonadales bacterium]
MLLLDRAFSTIIRTGTLKVIDAGGKTHTYGGSPGPEVTIRIHDAWTPWRIALRPYLALGESYMDGGFTVEDGKDIKDFLGLLLSNMRWHRDSSFHSRRGLWFKKLVSTLMQINPTARSRRNVAHHYDLSGALYDLFLDRDRQYSCAYFPDDSTSLDDAQEAKKAHLAAKLLLQPGQRVLDIGCGWGGLGLYLNRASNARVQGVTLSTEQLGVARKRAEDAGVADAVQFDLQDYRHLNGKFDRIVSVGMFEHVGKPHYQAYFDKIHELLDDDGVALIHTIGRADGPGRTDPWIRKYIFPGGYVPALSEVAPVIEQAGFYITDIEFLRLHYAKTLEAWYDRFRANRDKVVNLY